MVKNVFALVTPGEMLKEEFLVENGLCKISWRRPSAFHRNRIAEVVNNRRRITADTALRLRLYFSNSPEFWMNLQTHYDSKTASQTLMQKTSGASKLNAPLHFKQMRQF